MIARTPRDRGNTAEEQALAYLQAQGLILCERNFRCRFGEIDLIMRQGDALVFVEVRYRSRSDFGGAAATVTRAKQQRLIRTALSYLRRRATTTVMRFDVVAVTGTPARIEWIPNAFDAVN